MEENFRFAVFLLLPIAILAQNSTTCPYAKYGSDHTMCKYNEKGCVLGLLSRGITTEDVQIILTTHNELRNKVASGQQSGQPSATNMKEMVYDEGLGTVAQRWADQCTFGHDQNRRTDTYSYVGQNVAYTGSTMDDKGKPDFKAAINMWFGEVAKPGFNPQNINPFKFESGTGHYTQLEWANSNHVGCGFAYYKEQGFFKKLYVCNYGPGGNMIGGSMYAVGPAASACDKGKSTNYAGLCA